MNAVRSQQQIRRHKDDSKAIQIGERASHRLFVWSCLTLNQSFGLIVTPSPHGKYKSGISFNDTLALSEIYANLPKSSLFDARPADLVGGDASANLVLIGGKKCNRLSDEFQKAKHSSLTLDLDDGVIYDRVRHVVVTPEYCSANWQMRTTDNLLADYGLIVYSDNPFGKSTKLVQLAGIKGFGTRAAAIAVLDSRIVRSIEGILTQLLRRTGAPAMETSTVEILLKVAVSEATLQRHSIQIQKLVVSGGNSRLMWESETYRQLKPVIPSRLRLHITKTLSSTPVVQTWVNNEELRFPKSADRHNVIYLLAKQAREDYQNRSDNNGWLDWMTLSKRLWQLQDRNGIVEIPGDIKRLVVDSIKRWAASAQKRKELILSGDFTMDSSYINSEILAFDSNIQKRLVDLIHIVNHEEKHRTGSNFQFIESRPGRGYRINIHPALISIIESTSP
jgi:hypothetical protein